MAMFVLKQYN